jgi:hypothetical protein
VEMNVPDAFQVHRSNLHYVLLLLAFEDAVPTATGHAYNVEKLGTINHVVVYSAQGQLSSFNMGEVLAFSSCNTSSLDINLKAQCALILPQGCCDPGLDSWRRNLTCSVHLHWSSKGSL